MNNEKIAPWYHTLSCHRVGDTYPKLPLRYERISCMDDWTKRPNQAYHTTHDGERV